MARFIISGFADEIASSLDTQLEVLKKTHIRYIEMRGVNGKNLVDHTVKEVQDIKHILDKEGFKLSAIGSPIGKISINDDFAPHFELFKHTVEIAKILDCRYIRMFSFFIPHSESCDKYEKEVFMRLSILVDYARQHDIVLLHENEKEIYGESVANCKKILDTFDKNVMRGIFDPANFVQSNEETYPYGFKTLNTHIVYLHIKDCISGTNEVVPAGEGDGKLQEILSELASQNFDGFLSIEPHLHSDDPSVTGEDLFMKAYTALLNTIHEVSVFSHAQIIIG